MCRLLVRMVAVTPDDARRILLSMPGSFESEHHGHPDFRIKQGIFATLAPGNAHAVLRLPALLAESLENEDGNRCKIVSRIGGMGWLEVELEGADPEEFQGLAEVAWQSRGGR